MKCADAKPLLSSYIDTAMSGREMCDISEHLDGCTECSEEIRLLIATQRAVAALGRKQAPSDLALKLRVMASQEIAARQRRPLDALVLHWQNAIHAFMVPATAGMLSAVIIFGLLIGMLVPVQLQASNDVPTTLYTPPELSFSPFGFEMGAAADSLVIEAYIDSNGRVQDYRILSAPAEAQAIMPELKNMLLFTTFRPATSFGQPTNGRAILTFSGINVRG